MESTRTAVFIFQRRLDGPPWLEHVGALAAGSIDGTATADPSNSSSFYRLDVSATRDGFIEGIHYSYRDGPTTAVIVSFFIF